MKKKSSKKNCAAFSEDVQSAKKILQIQTKPNFNININEGQQKHLLASILKSGGGDGHPRGQLFSRRNGYVSTCLPRARSAIGT